ncbi:MAG TPA: 50S ribosomal protein L9 [Elusimicrobia bacterium]|nr:MAG: 50S ribosomal protein L9 [Elusimicrobia bacterium GWA2_66_18]OGR69732.1 MAG: 50S ribosomal protein L9 [Elusimicrobia bacterium GWC2_65_9]HAZ09107.1 50S ribosomal protein L9 [Elusimicrobiota bacterium]
MKVILRSTIDNLGRPGDIKEVAAGYARNFLLPRKLAESATPSAVKYWEKGREKRAALVSSEIKAAKDLAEKLSGVNLTFSMPASEEGKLFGSVGKTDVLKSLKAAGYDITKNSVRLETAIKTTGEHEVELRLQPEVSVKVKVTVSARE